MDAVPSTWSVTRVHILENLLITKPVLRKRASGPAHQHTHTPEQPSKQTFPFLRKLPQCRPQQVKTVSPGVPTTVKALCQKP